MTTAEQERLRKLASWYDERYRMLAHTRAESDRDKRGEECTRAELARTAALLREIAGWSE